MNQLSIDFAAVRACGYAPLSSQQWEVLTLLVSGWTTVGEALQKIGCYALSQRVGELARMGYDIEKTWRDLPSGKRVRAYRISR